MTQKCPLLTLHLLPGVSGWTLLTLLPSPLAPQLLLVQGAMGTGARVRAWPQSQAERPAKPD